jgi:hypothetical protein
MNVVTSLIRQVLVVVRQTNTATATFIYYRCLVNFFYVQVNYIYIILLSQIFGGVGRLLNQLYVIIGLYHTYMYIICITEFTRPPPTPPNNCISGRESLYTRLTDVRPALHSTSTEAKAMLFSFLYFFFFRNALKLLTPGGKILLSPDHALIMCKSYVEVLFT